MGATPPRIGLLSRGERHGGRQSARAETMLAPLVRAFAELGVGVEPVVYCDDAVEEVRDQLVGLDGVLVWVNPVQDGADRSRLDAVLRRVAGQGVWVSAHPDVILRMGTKAVLFSTRSLAWGTDTELYRSMREFTERFPGRLDQRRVLVLKQGRGTGGAGVWKVELTGPRFGGESDGRSRLDAVVCVQHAETKDSATAEMPLAEFLERCRGYFAWSGFLVDQPFQERLAEGMIRAYFVHDEVVGFCHQWPTGLLSGDQAGDRGGENPPAAHVMEDPDTGVYQPLRKTLETEWVPQMTRLLELDSTALPVLWDADFLYGPPTGPGLENYVLCEINVSAVWPYPQQAAANIAQAALARVRENIASRG
ncbi:MAG TPA: Cj0069 family protein [Pseudonocardia sp.]|uniref:Cj0069 family protein n=1 Tax=Pseudonocardia sp. TaxID=60912 RepID=UPI002BCBAEB7|nr:Cj0069 family protein [Pseudonocardia sp.]HTF46335.1 Cj0069 family protein [Pseudonocardia sp.]